MPFLKFLFFLLNTLSKAGKAAGRLRRRSAFFNFVHEIAEVERLGKHFRIARGVRIGIEGHCGKARNEHDLQIRIDFSCAARKLDTVHFWHDDIGQQQREWLLAQSFIGAGTVIEMSNVIARLSSAFTRKRRISLSSSASRILFMGPSEFLAAGSCLLDTDDDSVFTLENAFW